MWVLSVSTVGMREDQGERLRETHTVRSHGWTLITKHKHDWLILALLGAAEAALYKIDPFKRYVSKNMMDDLKYPLKDGTFPFWSVPVSTSPLLSFYWKLFRAILRSLL